VRVLIAMRVLGVDFGLRHLGIALSDEEGILARPLRVLHVTSVRQAPAAVAEVAAEADAETIVVGVPLGLEGEERREEVRRVQRFAHALRKVSGLDVFLTDESLSSREAEGEHARSAAIILQRWLDRPRKSKGAEA